MTEQESKQIELYRMLVICGCEALRTIGQDAQAAKLKEHHNLAMGLIDRNERKLSDAKSELTKGK